MKRRSRIKRKPVQEETARTASLSGTIRRAGARFLKVSVVLGVITLLSVSFLSAYHYLLRSPHIRLERVQIKGANKQLRKELITLCGINAKPNLLAVKLEALKQRIEAHPWIRSAKLQRRLPHTLIIEIQRQEPAAMVLADKLYYLNSWGEAFKVVSPSDPVDLPVITGVSPDRISDGKCLNAAAQVISILQSETGAWSTEKLSEVNIHQNGQVSLYYTHLKAEIRCNWHHLSEKIKGLRRVANHLETSGKMDQVTQIDLNYADGAVVSFKTG